MRTSSKEYMSFLIILVICGGLFLVGPLSGHNIFLIGLLTSACLYVVYVVSWDLLEGYTGMLNFGQLLFAGVAAYTVALIEVNYKVGRPLAILAGFLAGVCSSFLISLPSLRVRSTYFALVSFAVLLVFYRVTLTFISVSGGDYGLAIPRVFSREALYHSAILIMTGTLILTRILVRSRLGKALQAIREDEETARAVGINIQGYKILVCLISAAFTSLGGISFFYTMGHVGPEIFSMSGSFDIVIMGVVGGAGTIFGAALGGALLSLLLEFMRPVAEYRSLLYALLLVTIIMVAPKGMWGSVPVLREMNFLQRKKEIREPKND